MINFYEFPQIAAKDLGIDTRRNSSQRKKIFKYFYFLSKLTLDPYLSRQLRQCYSCTARFKGCGEILDPHYVSNYIRPCTSSCIVFRNPNDLNRKVYRSLYLNKHGSIYIQVITRDCSTSWPQIHAKSGLHKLLGSDAFFCQESL